MCTNVIVFLQEEKETVDMCTNVIVFIQEEKETVDMCTNCYCFSSGGERDCRPVYSFHCFFFRSRKRL